MTTKALYAIIKNLQTENHFADTVGYSSKTDEIIIRKSFFYTHGGSAESLADKINELLIATSLDGTCKITDKGEVWKDFRGGASVAQQSHWYVKLQAL